MKNFLGIVVLSVFAFGGFLFFGMPGLANDSLLKKGGDLMGDAPQGYPAAVFAGGCFWCTESEYRGLDGVLYTRVGYMGGDTENPSYQDITTGKTGHAEVVKVTFDPQKITYPDLVEFFLTTVHDPTQLNRQGVDVGTQYRSAIFSSDEAQEKIAREVIAKVDASGQYDSPIVTTIEPYGTFWEGEDYHQQYYEKYEEKTGRDHVRVILKKAGKLKP